MTSVNVVPRVGRATNRSVPYLSAAVLMFGATALAISTLGSDGMATGPVGGECRVEVARSSGPTAFPGAEGFGRFARGGRGGAVYSVTTLADDGPGSLRACAEARGPRTCIFQTSGTIAVDSWISVQHPYLTIAGQTSPGGIALKLGRSANTPLLIQTHDVVVRYLRLRPGPAESASENVDTIQISAGAHDVILDHLSTSWPTDEGVNIVGDGHRRRPCMDTRNITVQWSILSEGLDRSNRGAHSRGTYFGYGARDITFHHNLIADNDRRNPLLNTRGQFDMVNNVIFNSRRYNGEFYTRFGELTANVIGNVAIIGSSSVKNSQMYMINYFRDYPARFAIYLKDNFDIHRRRKEEDDRLVLEPGDWPYVVSNPIGVLSLSSRSITGPAQAYRDVLAYAGATRPKRDAADLRVIGDLKMCRGAIIDDPEQVGGWPTLTGPAAPDDEDNDGIGDVWETAHGLSSSDPYDGKRVVDSEGRTNLERYLSEIAGDRENGNAGSAIGPDPDPTCGFAVSTGAPLPVVRLNARPASVSPGGASTISWTGEHLKSCKAFGNPALSSGERVVRPVATRAYQIHCTGDQGGDAIDSVLVYVVPKANRAAAAARPSR